MADIDTMGYSEEELEQIAGGSAPAVDTMGYSEEELEQIANQPPQDPGFGANPPGKEPWFKAGPVEIARSPLDVDWIGAAKKTLGDEFFSGDGKSQSMSVTDNPLLMTSAVPQAVGGATAAGLSKVGNFIRSGAERFATSPMISNTAKTVNKGLNYVPFGGEAKRVVKAIPDAQKGIAWALDNTPEALGKFANILRQATQHSASGLATADFLMSQSNPEYQEIKKNMFEGGSTPLKQSGLFPKEVRRGNEVATVSNEEEFMEALAEGFR